jgi:hypothetical protein
MDTNKLKLLKLCHPTDPRYLVAPAGEPPKLITLSDLRQRRYGMSFVSQVGNVIAEYTSNDTDGWQLCKLAFEPLEAA